MGSNTATKSGLFNDDKFAAKRAAIVDTLSQGEGRADGPQPPTCRPVSRLAPSSEALGWSSDSCWVAVRR
jgi:hypothetical protein